VKAEGIKAEPLQQEDKAVEDEPKIIMKKSKKKNRKRNK
jgi:hypothetical protein